MDDKKLDFLPVITVINRSQGLGVLNMAWISAISSPDNCEQWETADIQGPVVQSSIKLRSANPGLM